MKERKRDRDNSRTEWFGEEMERKYMYYALVDEDRKSDKTVTNLDLTTKDNVTRDSFKKRIKRFAFVVSSSVTNRILF